MIRAATSKGIFEIVGLLVTCLLVGSLAGRAAKYFGAPMEIRLLAFTALAAVTFAIWYIGRKID